MLFISLAIPIINDDNSETFVCEDCSKNLQCQLCDAYANVNTGFCNDCLCIVCGGLDGAHHYCPDFGYRTCNHDYTDQLERIEWLGTKCNCENTLRHTKNETYDQLLDRQYLSKQIMEYTNLIRKDLAISFIESLIMKEGVNINSVVLDTTNTYCMKVGFRLVPLDPFLDKLFHSKRMIEKW